MTVDDLMTLFQSARQGTRDWNGTEWVGVYGGDRAGVTAIVRALRDEIVPDGEWWDHADVKGWFNEILGDAGEKVAEGNFTNPSEGRVIAPATDPIPDAAPAVCVWTPYTDEPLGADWWRTCKDVRHRYKFDGHHPCASCGKPIKFTEAK